MQNFLKKLLSESGDVSTVRLMSILSLVVGVFIGIYGVCESKDLSGIAQVCGVFVSAAFIGKVSQKFAEDK
jgi:hypothetical protein